MVIKALMHNKCISGVHRLSIPLSYCFICVVYYLPCASLAKTVRLVCKKSVQLAPKTG